jgi:hypothetical protein
MSTGITAINEQVREHSAFVIVGQQYLVDRLIIGLLANGHVLLEGVPGLAKTLAVKTLAGAIHASFSASSSRPTCCPPTSSAPRSTTRKTAPSPPQGPGVRQHHPGRRNQPRPGQGAERPAGSHAGTPGHHRRHHLQAARTLPGAGHPEPHRAGGHLPAARGAGRPLHAQAQGHLPDHRGGAPHPRRHGHHDRTFDTKPPGRAEAPSCAPARWSTRSTSTTRSRTTSSASSSPPASPPTSWTSSPTSATAPRPARPWP